MAKEKKEKVTASFLDLNDSLNKISPNGSILEDSLYARIDEWIGTGSYILNAALSGSLLGGMPNRRSLCLAGAEGTGKTYLAMSIVRNAQAMGYSVVYCDSEGSIDIDFVKRLGVDTQKFRIENISTVEEFATLAAKLNEQMKAWRDKDVTPPKVMLVLDSLGNLSSTKEKEDTTSGSGKRDMTKQQAVRRTFRVIGNDLAMNAIPFIICAHTYAAIGSFFPHDDISGGGGIKYNASIIFMLTKSKLSDKDSEDHVKKKGLDPHTKIGIVVTLSPAKQRFARPIKVQIHIPFYKKPNPFVGLETFVSWENCGIIRGKCLNEKDFKKLSPAEQKSCYEFEVDAVDKKGNAITSAKTKMYAQPKDTARTLVCRHLGGECDIKELYTEKVFSMEVLKELDEKIIKPTFMLPSIESLEDLAEVSAELDGVEIDFSEEVNEIKVASDYANYDGINHLED
jgi:RecA/RadA recombinase